MFLLKKLLDKKVKYPNFKEIYESNLINLHKKIYSFINVCSYEKNSPHK